jgi:putative ATPase
LFEAAGLQEKAPRPLADRLRPSSLEEVVGQEHLLGEHGILARMVKAGRLGSVIFWGPPGTGKTTVARLLAELTDLHFEQLSAIQSGVADLRKVFDAARARRELGRGTLLFVDEIHRFNRSQQDSFLPYMEDGTVILVGATTENPSFELNSALLSRASVLTFKRLDEEGLKSLLARAEGHEGRKLPLTDDARAALIAMADGDGRAVEGAERSEAGERDHPRQASHEPTPALSEPPAFGGRRNRSASGARVPPEPSTEDELHRALLRCLGGCLGGTCKELSRARAPRP